MGFGCTTVGNFLNADVVPDLAVPVFFSTTIEINIFDMRMRIKIKRRIRIRIMIRIKDKDKD